MLFFILFPTQVSRTFEGRTVSLPLKTYALKLEQSSQYDAVILYQMLVTRALSV